MAEQITTPDIASESAVDPSPLHVASGQDAAEADDRADRLDAILSRGDVRDQAAERRDRSAEGRSTAAREGQAAIDRYWAGRDRDSAAGDRADLVGLLHSGRSEPTLAHPEPTSAKPEPR
jgi:hypothetical protein